MGEAATKQEGYMMQKLKPEVWVTDRATDTDDLHHYFCCDENRGLCGSDLADVPFRDDVENLCVVCRELDVLECERCGA
jgi:hypothetical protein